MAGGGQTPSGRLLLATWHLQPDLAIQYAVRLGPAAEEEAAEPPSVSDVFVNLDEAIRLLTSVSGQTLKVGRWGDARLPPAGEAAQYQDHLDGPDVRQRRRRRLLSSG
jgi:hypothetical protein